MVKDEGFPVQIMECLKKVPMPVAGVALAVATLGGLFHLYHLDIQPILGIVSALLLMLPLLQCLCVKGQFKQYMSTPVMASTIGTVSMALIVLSGYIKPFFGLLALTVFLVGGTLHTLLIGWFTYRFLFRTPVKDMYASWFILYVGYATVSIVSPAFGLGEFLGLWVFYFSLAMYLSILPLMVWRYLAYRNIPESMRPLGCIFAAPPALCLTAYLKVTAIPVSWVVLFLAVMTFASLAMVVCFLPGYLMLPFYPSYAAFTFPFAISAMAGRLLEMFLAKTGEVFFTWHWIAVGQMVLASALTIYALLHYLKAVAGKQDRKKSL